MKNVPVSGDRDPVLGAQGGHFLSDSLPSLGPACSCPGDQPQSLEGAGSPWGCEKGGVLVPQLSLTSSWAVSVGKQQVWKPILSKGPHLCRKGFETHHLLQHAFCLCPSLPRQPEPPKPTQGPGWQRGGVHISPSGTCPEPIPVLGDSLTVWACSGMSAFNGDL